MLDGRKPSHQWAQHSSLLLAAHAKILPCATHPKIQFRRYYWSVVMQHM